MMSAVFNKIRIFTLVNYKIFIAKHDLKVPLT